MNYKQYLAYPIPILFALFMLGCSGGDDPVIVGTGLEGTAAVGKPLQNVTVTLKAANGKILTRQTDSLGKYSFKNLQDETLTKPYLLMIDVGNGERLYSIAHVIDEKEDNISNLHPLSNVVSRNWFRSRGRDIDSEFDAVGVIASPPDKVSVKNIANALKSLLNLAYGSFLIDDTFDFMETSFSADGNAFDKLLDNVDVDRAGQIITIRLTDPISGFAATIIFDFDLAIDLSDTDTLDPNVPEGQLAARVDDTRAVVVWNSSTDNVGIAGYNIYREDNPSMLLATSPYPVYTDSGLTAEVQYCYQIEAFDGAGNTSVKTAAGTACTMTLPADTSDVIAPVTITGVQATAVDINQISVVWDVAVENDVIGYDILRSATGSPSSKIATVVANAFVDNNVDATVEHCYIVRAFDAAGNRSPDSVESCAAVESTPPVTTASPAADQGPFLSEISVVLSCDDGAGSGCNLIYYTTDDSVPTTSFTQYTAAITLSADTTLRYYAVDHVGNVEAVNSPFYDFALLPVTTASPIGGLYNTAQNVSLTCVDDNGAACSAIYYTTDGNPVTTASTLYTTAIAVNANTVLKFLGVDAAGNEGLAKTETYTIDELAPSSTATPGEGTYAAAQSVELTCDDGAGSGCAAIYYTTGDTVPTTASPVYQSAIQIAAGTTTLNYFSVDNAGNEGAISTDVYDIIIPDALKLDVNVASAPVASDGRVLYAITVSNTLSTSLTNISVGFAVPTGISFAQGTDDEPAQSTNCSGFVCNAGEMATWNVSTLAAGTSKTFTVNALVATGQVNATPIALSVSATATELASPVVVNKTVLIENNPAAHLALTADADPVKAGQPYTLSVDLGNVGTANLGTPELRMILPVGVTVNSASNSGVIDTVNNEVVWTLPSVLPGSSLHREVIVTSPILISTLSSDILKARAELTYNGSTQVNVTAEHAVSLLNTDAPLLFDISVAKSPVVPAGRLLYNMTVTNVSSRALNTVKVLYRVPAGIQFSQGTDDEPNQTTNCSGFVCNAHEEASWTFGLIPTGESKTITVNALVVANPNDGYLMSAPIQVTADELLADMTLLHSVPAQNAPAAEIALSADKDPVKEGETYTLRLDMGNISTSNLTTTELRAYLPAGVTVDSASDGGMITGNVVSWDLTTVLVGESRHREVIVTAASLPQGINSGILKATAELFYNGSTEVNIIAEHAVSVLKTDAPLLFDISVAQSPVVTGGRMLYNMTVTNVTSRALNNVKVLYRVPAGVQFSQGSDDEPSQTTNCSGFVCNAHEEASWTFGIIPTGESKTISMNALVIANPDDGYLLRAPIQVTADELLADMTLLHSIATDNTAEAQLALSADKDPVKEGEMYTLSLDLGNISTSNLLATELRAYLPTGVTVDSASDGGLITGNVVFWDLTTVSVGESRHREVIVTAAGLPLGINSGILKATAELIYNGSTEVNVIAEHAVSVLKSDAPLLFDISVAQSPTVPGGRMLYNMTVTNVSSRALNNVKVLYRVPAGVQFSQGSDDEPSQTTNCSGFVCNAHEEASWTYSIIPTGESKTISMNALVISNPNDGYLLSAPVQVTADELLADMTRLHSVPAYNLPAAELAISADKDLVNVADGYTLSLDVGNISASNLATTGLLAILPAGVTINSATGGGVIAGNEVFWDLSTVLVGASQHLEVAVTVAGLPLGMTSDILKTTAELTFNGSTEVNVIAEHAVNVVSPAPLLSLVVAASPNPLPEGGILTYTITVQNITQAVVSSVNVLLRMPAGLRFTQSTDITPAMSVNCSGFVCDGHEEAVWTFPTIQALGDPLDTETITINATLQPGFLSGSLTSAPIYVTADTQAGSINVLNTVPVTP